MKDKRDGEIGRRGDRAIALLLLLLLPASLLFAQTKKVRTYVIDPNLSELAITLPQEGMIGKRYPTHSVLVKSFSGKVELPRDEKQAAAELTAEAKSFANNDKLMSEFERRGFHDVLHNKVLEKDRYPQIVFKSVSVSELKKTGETRRFTLHGDLTLRGTTRRVALPVVVTLEKDQLRATGEGKLKQSDFGITPYEGGAGLIKMGDEVKISFSIVAKAQ